MFKNIDILDIVVILLVILIIISIIKNKTEKFSSTTYSIQDTINTVINDLYKVDIDAMRNIAQITKNILSTEELTIPAQTINAKNLESKNTTINGTLNVTDIATFNDGINVKGDVSWAGKLNVEHLEVLGNLSVSTDRLNNILPKTTILLWANTLEKIPPGWAPCDGKMYSIDSSNNRQFNYIESMNGYQTPILNDIIPLFGLKNNIKYIIKIF